MKFLSTKSVPTLVLLGLLTVGAVVAMDATAKPDSTATMSRAYLHAYSLPSSGLAIEGYCPVSYFAVNKAVQGKPEFASTYNDVTYYFASASRKRDFERNPEKYLPAYGGWCAFGMAIQDKFPVDPTAFKISEGRLLLFLRNRNIDALAKWNENEDRPQIVKADAFWAKVSR